MILWILYLSRRIWLALAVLLASGKVEEHAFFFTVLSDPFISKTPLEVLVKFCNVLSNHSSPKSIGEIRGASSRSGKTIGHKRAAAVIQWPQISTQLISCASSKSGHLGRISYPKRPENGQNQLDGNWRSADSVKLKFFLRNLCHSKPGGNWPGAERSPQWHLRVGSYLTIRQGEQKKSVLLAVHPIPSSVAIHPSSQSWYFCRLCLARLYVKIHVNLRASLD